MAYLQGFGPEGDYLRSRFGTQWKALRGYTDAQMGYTSDETDVRVVWGNKNSRTPNDAAWVRFNVRHSGAKPASVGGGTLHRHEGMLVIEVFAPTNQGEGTLDDHCDDAAAIFRDHTSQQGLRFRTPFVVNVGQTGGRFKKDVLIPFVRDTVFS